MGKIGLKKGQKTSDFGYSGVVLSVEKLKKMQIIFSVGFCGS